MKIDNHLVDLNLPPSERWKFLQNFSKEIDELIGCYLADFKGEELIFQNIEFYKSTVVPESYQQEISCIAAMCSYSENEVLIANLYYDILKFFFGCTAFAFHNGKTMLHARNLDWHTDNDLLSKHTCVFHFQKSGKTIFKTVGWPGFIGALSGTKPGCFSVTLNAVLSQDSPEIAYPISFLLRDVLAEAENFTEARTTLEQTTIASDCLLLLTGINANEAVVIERTPKRFATRMDNDIIVVTNDYKVLENENIGEENVLQATSCSRFDRTKYLISNMLPNSKEVCIDLLRDAEVMMGITVQQMVFDNQTGEILIIKTKS